MSTLVRTSLLAPLFLLTTAATGNDCDGGPAGNGAGGDALAQGDQGGPPGHQDALADLGPDAATAPEAPTAVAADLAYLREEEKLARDVYRTLGARWGLQVFTNIASSEETHTSRVATRLAELGLPDPVVDDATGAFVDASLDALYDALTARGATSLVDALHVGATIEDLDLLDLADKRTHTDDAATLAVYDDLMCGSRNHLRAYVGQLAQRGATYEAQYLTQAEVDAIVGGARETCGTR